MHEQIQIFQEILMKQIYFLPGHEQIKKVSRDSHVKLDQLRFHYGDR